jgi:translation initiation factor IF-1
MARTDAFKVEGIVLEALANGTYRVELANGHQLLGFVAGRARSRLIQFVPGDRVSLSLSPYDLSEGRIGVSKQKI